MHAGGDLLCIGPPSLSIQQGVCTSTQARRSNTLSPLFALGDNMTMLVRLLNDNARFALLHRGTVNHLPMTLVALSKLGASDERLVEYFGYWEQKFALPREGVETPLSRRDWTSGLGRREAFWPLADLFAVWIAEEGVEKVVGAVAPRLERGPGALAFHAMIRLAYGVEAGHQGEVAAGLGSWVAAHRDLSLGLTGAQPAASVAEGLSRIRAAVGGSPPVGGTISNAMVTVAAKEEFRAALAAPPPGELLREMSRAAIRLYWTTANFTALHMVTAVHVARVILERFPSLATPALSQALWAEWCAAYATVGAPPLEEPAAEDRPLGWAPICASAVRQNNDHVIKLTYTCRAEEARYGDAFYRQAAGRLALPQPASA